MKLRELTIQNFRSYGETPTKVELDDGIILFEGDIGSGKSSILYAIEFALFGLGELEGRSILRGSANSGKVELEFEVGGREYKVTRTIERKKGVKATTIQTQGWIEEPSGMVSTLSPTELRSRILQILNFKEKPSAKASSRIYRYAVFTPQELMKEVLSQKPEDRLDTLRRAFGVEDYSFASANTGVIISHLDTQIKINSGLSANLPQKELELETRRKELGSNETKLADEERYLRERENKLVETRSLFEDLEADVKRMRDIQVLVPLLEKNLSQLQTQLVEQRNELQRNSKMLEEIGVAERRLSSLKQEYERYLALRDKLRELEVLSEDLRSIEREISKLNETIVFKEANLKAELELKKEQSKKVQSKIESYEREIERLATIEQAAGNLRNKVESLSNLQAKVEGLKSQIGAALALLESRRSRITEAQNKIKALDGISKESKCPLCGQTLNSEHLKKIDAEYQAEIQGLRGEEKSFETNLSKLNVELNALEKERNENRKAQRELENLEQEIAKINQLNTLLESSTKESGEIESTLQSIEASLLSRDFARDTSKALERTIERKDILTQSLKDYEKFREHYQRLEDSGVIEAYQSAQSIVSKKDEVLDLVNRLENRSKEIGNEISKSTLELEEKKKELEQGEPIILQYAKIKDEVRSLEEECNGRRMGIQVLLEKVRQAREDEKALARQVEELRRNAAMVVKLSDMKSWLSENFMPAIGDIERHVLVSINEEFAQVFQRIFSILSVEEGDLSATIDDRFTPIIEQAGYELDVQSLSGGERTAVALAYRLTLNYMVKRANEALQANLLILDEPTEGFSKEQIYRFRNALEELSSDQVIIVSHERDLEPMANRVFRVEKAKGESIVTQISS